MRSNMRNRILARHPLRHRFAYRRRDLLVSSQADCSAHVVTRCTIDYHGDLPAHFPSRPLVEFR